MDQPIKRRTAIAGMAAAAASAVVGRSRAAEPVQLKLATADTMSDTS